MPYIKQLFRKMNLDADVRSLQPGDYRELTNGIPVSPAISSYANPILGIISNVLGNALVSFSLPGGTNRVVGFLEDRAKKRSFYAVYNSTASNNSIYQYTSSGITLVFRSALLGFSTTDFVAMDIIDDILVLTNNVVEIKKINVTKAIAGATYTPAADEINLIKRPPQLVLTLTGTDNSRTNNYIKERYFQFMYQYVYEDYDNSVWSQVSLAITNSSSYAAGMDTVEVTIPSSEVIPNTVIQINYAVRIDGSNEWTIYRSDYPVAGSLSSRTHNFYNDVLGQTVAGPESIKWNDSVPITCKSLRFFKKRLFTFNNTEGYNATDALITGATIAATSVAAGTDRYFKGRGAYGVAIKYFDGSGRHAGVKKFSNGDILIPERSGTAIAGSWYRITWDLTSVAQAFIPTWATHYSMMVTKCNNIAFFIQNRTDDAFGLTKVADDWTSGPYTDLSDGRYQFDSANFSAQHQYDAIDISGLTRNKIGYTWQDGDRIRFYPNTGVVIDVKILRQEGRFLLCEPQTFTPTAPTNGNRWIYEIYTPKQSEQELFYEFGNKYVITSPGGGSRAFGTLTGTLIGDIEISNRPMFKYDASYDASDPYSNVLIADTNVVVEKMNYHDVKFTNWVQYGWRSDVRQFSGTAQIVKRNYMRFGGEYILNSKILGLNSFEALDDYPLPVENGIGTILADAGEVLVAIHEIETSALYIGQGFVSTGNALGFLTKTDQVIGDDRKYQGGYGTINPESVISRNGIVYFVDALKGVVIRRSQDGLTPISEYGVRGRISQLCAANIAAGSTARIYGGWDPQYDCYTIRFSTASYTLYYHEKTNSWVCKTQLQPEFFGILGQKQIHFTEGALWLQSTETNYNNWFGSQYNRSLDFEIGQDSLEKVWEALEADVENIYVTGGSNENIVLLYHKNGGTLQTRINYLDFVQRGSAWRSSFFSDLNDPNFASTDLSKYGSPNLIRGLSAFLNILNNYSSGPNPMKSITVFFRLSPNTDQ